MAGGVAFRIATRMAAALLGDDRRTGSPASIYYEVPIQDGELESYLGWIKAILDPERLSPCDDQFEHYSLGDILMTKPKAMELANKAIETLTRLVECAATKGPEAKLAHGKLLEFNETYGGAIDLYCKLPKENSEARARLALTLIKSGRADQALDVAQELVASHPDMVFKSLTVGAPFSVYTVLGDARAVSGLSKEALEAYEKALELEPNDNQAAAMATRLSIAASDVDSAIRFGSQITRGQGYDDLIAGVNLVRNDPSALAGLEGNLAQISSGNAV